MLPAERHGQVLGIDVNTPLLGGSAKVSLRKSAHLCKEFQKKESGNGEQGEPEAVV